MKKYFLTLIICILFLFNMVAVYAAAIDSAIVSPSSFSLYHSEQKTVNGQFRNGNSFCNVGCQYWTSATGVWTSLGTVETGQTKTYTFVVSAPSSGSSTTTVSVKVSCAYGGGFCSYPTETWDGAVTMIYGPSPEESAAIQKQSSATSELNNAKSLLSEANSALNTAQSKVKEASNLGADIGTAQLSLNSVSSAIENANSYLSSAQTAYDQGVASLNSKSWNLASSNFDTAISKSQQTQSSATTAKSNSDSAKAQATSIIEEWNRLKTVAQNKISDANSAIDTAKQRIQVGEGVIYNATVLGLDTAQAKSQIATARTKTDSATSYYQEASSMFKSATNKESFEGSKSKAQSAIDLSKEAESLATQAYGELAKQVTIAGEAGKSITNANTEISQMNEILTKLDYVIISTEKYGVNLADTKNVASTSKTNVDSAEDLLSQAKNNIASGKFTDAANLGIQARDKAASARNRLDTIAHTMSLNSESALEKAYEIVKQKVADAESEVASASSTYGATAELVVTAQNYVGQAKKSLEEAKTQIDKVKTASGLSDLVKELDASFKAIDETNKQATNGINDAKSAKLGLVKKVAGIGAAVAGAGGGGFLYYRWRKKNKGKKEKKYEKKEEEKETHEEKKPKHEKQHKEKSEKKVLSFFKKLKCPECGHKIKKSLKFCPHCGKKVGD